MHIVYKIQFATFLFFPCSIITMQIFIWALKGKYSMVELQKLWWKVSLEAKVEGPRNLRPFTFEEQ